MTDIALKIYSDLQTFFDFDHKKEITASDLISIYDFKVIDIVVLFCFIEDFDGLKIELLDSKFNFHEGKREFSCINFKVVKE